MNYNETFQSRLAAQKKSVLSSPITEQLEISKINDQRIQEIYDAMSAVTGKPVYSDFAWRSGKVMGVLRHIQQNPKKRRELLEVTHLTNAHIDLWWQCGGNLPYVNTNSNTLNEGRPMDCEICKELLKVVAAELGVLLEDSDLIDINENNWNRLYNKALEDAQQTISFNNENVNVTYDE